VWQRHIYYVKIALICWRCIQDYFEITCLIFVFKYHSRKVLRKIKRLEILNFPENLSTRWGLHSLAQGVLVISTLSFQVLLFRYHPVLPLFMPSHDTFQGPLSLEGSSTLLVSLSWLLFWQVLLYGMILISPTNHMLSENTLFIFVSLVLGTSLISTG
jgi:hypothetical protein